MTIWQRCNGQKYINPIEISAWRLVESQQKTSTRRLVDTVEEHDILETLLESTKPALDEHYLKNYHYLLYTPFRYPPLKYGSRFGSTTERAIWYGSATLKTAMAEVAFYRKKFIQDSKAQLHYIHLAMTAFSVDITSSYGIDLTTTPFLDYRNKISSTNTYQFSQPLGAEMRVAKTHAFTYFSARSSEDAINVGVFDIDAFATHAPSHYESWTCIANVDHVEFYPQHRY